MVEDMSNSEQNYGYCPLLTTTTNPLPTRAKLTPTLPNGATSRAYYSARAADLEDPLLLVNRITGRLELVEAAHRVDGSSRRRPNGSTIVGNDLSAKYSLLETLTSLSHPTISM